MDGLFEISKKKSDCWSSIHAVLAAFYHTCHLSEYKKIYSKLAIFMVNLEAPKIDSGE